jgi:hypothetical protein
MDEGEDGGVRADGERQGCYDYGCKEGSAAHSSNGAGCVAYRFFQPAPPPGSTRIFRDQSPVAELPSGGGRGVFRAQPVPAVVGCFALEVELHLLLEFGVLSPTAE